jgi:hypothetical protein
MVTLLLATNDAFTIARMKAPRGMMRIAGGPVTLGVEDALAAFLSRFPRRELDAIDRDTGTTNRTQLAALYEQSLSRRRTVTLAPFWIERLPKHRGRDFGSSFRSIVRALARDGYRLPTPDEWEHAYAAGTRTLFPWGSRWRRSGRGGLRVIEDRAGECTSVYRTFKGGDGGCLSHGGSRYAWITSASSFVEMRDEWDEEYDEGIWYGGCAVRRVRSI